MVLQTVGNILTGINFRKFLNDTRRQQVSPTFSGLVKAIRTRKRKIQEQIVRITSCTENGSTLNQTNLDSNVFE